MLVLAVAVLVGEDFGGGVRLVASQAEGKADVAKIEGDVIVQRLNFFIVRGLALHQLFFFSANLRRGRARIALQAGVPAAHLLPVGKRRQLDGGLFWLATPSFLLQ